jgi:hypothetical protein
MKNNFKLYILIAISFFLPHDVYAYFDPGTATFIIQSLIAFLGSVLIFISNPIRYIKNFINKFKKKDKEKENAKNPEEL